MQSLPEKHQICYLSWTSSKACLSLWKDFTSLSDSWNCLCSHSPPARPEPSLVVIQILNLVSEHFQCLPLDRGLIPILSLHSGWSSWRETSTNPCFILLPQARLCCQVINMGLLKNKPGEIIPTFRMLGLSLINKGSWGASSVLPGDFSSLWG